MYGVFVASATKKESNSNPNGGNNKSNGENGKSNDKNEIVIYSVQLQKSMRVYFSACLLYVNCLPIKACLITTAMKYTDFCTIR